MATRTARCSPLTRGAATVATVWAVTGGCAPSGGSGAEAESARAEPSARIAADHHVHIRSADGAATMDRLMEAFGTPPGASGEPSSAIGAADVIEALDVADAGQALVLSIAYMFGVPDVEVEDEHARVRAENDYIAAEVAQHPDRLVGACSVNPLADYALEEVERCGDDPRLTVLKLHLANSDVDLRDPDHVARLAEVFQKLARLDMPAMVHMRTRNPEYGARDARIFIDDVLSQAPRLPVQIAHMAGWGGYDDATDAALGAFADAIEEGRLDGARYTFDLAAVVFEPAAAGADTSLQRRTAEANARLAERIGQIGAERVVYATDWPSWPPVPDPLDGIAANATLIEGALPVTAAEMATILSNVGPLLGDR